MEDKECLSWQYFRDWIILKFDIIEYRFKMRCLGAARIRGMVQAWMGQSLVWPSQWCPAGSRFEHRFRQRERRS